MTTKQDRLFLAIGAADPVLLERSCRRRATPAVRWVLAAACLTLLCTVVLTTYFVSRAIPQNDPQGGNIGTQPYNGLELKHEGTLHLASICYDAKERSDFLLYVNEERYYGVWEGEDYVIRPITPSPEGLPACDLTISHWWDISPEEAAKEVRADLEAAYSVVLEPEESADGCTISAYNGTASGAEWDAATARVTLVNDFAGGVFTLTARFFTEATEGFGADFADMAATFQATSAEVTIPAWLTSLRETVDALLPAVFSNDWTAAGGLLTEDARVSAYQEDVSDQVSISAVDISPDSDEEPSTAVISVRHRLSSEEPYDTLTMELVIQRDGCWKAQRIALER